MAERMNHDKMRRVSELADESNHAPNAQLPNPAREPIPGEHDHTTEAPTQPDIVGTTGYGGDLPAVDVDPTIDEETKKQIRWEGGGRVKKST